MTYELSMLIPIFKSMIPVLNKKGAEMQFIVKSQQNDFELHLNDHALAASLLPSFLKIQTSYS